jgi:thiosulfate dehydrogenase
MPYLQTSHATPVLTDAQAWDVAAFVNAQPRPGYDQHNDWKGKDVEKKPFDCPVGPYADSFPQQQHKYGPFAPIVMVKK